MPVTLAHVHDRVVKLLVDSGNSNQMCVILKEAVSNTEGSILSQVLLRIKELQRQGSALSSQVSCPLQKSPPQCVYPVNLCLNTYSNKNFSFFFLEYLNPLFSMNTERILLLKWQISIWLLLFLFPRNTIFKISSHFFLHFLFHRAFFHSWDSRVTLQLTLGMIVPHFSSGIPNHLCACACSVTKLCPTLWDPMDCSRAPLSTGFPREEYWNGLPFLSPGNLSNSGLKPTSLALLADSLPLSHLGSPT